MSQGTALIRELFEERKFAITTARVLMNCKVISAVEFSYLARNDSVSIDLNSVHYALQLRRVRIGIDTQQSRRPFEKSSLSSRNTPTGLGQTLGTSKSF